MSGGWWPLSQMRRTTFGHFLTRPSLWPLSHGEWALADDLVWIEPCGKLKVVAGGTRINGASIPRWMWPVMGHPFRTDYIYPAALHDGQCGLKEEPSEVVHDRFYRALRAEGVPAVRAHAMGAAVDWKGPYWSAEE